MLAALGIREGDLLLLKGLTKGSDGKRYISDGLKLANLSFLWRHASLCKQFGYTAEEWRILLKLLHVDLSKFADPKAAFDFLQLIDLFKASDFSVDEINWLLAADRSAKAAVKESDAATFLTNMRKELQELRVEFDPAAYPFLQPALDEEQLAGLVTSLLRKLGRNDGASARPSMRAWNARSLS